MKLSPMQLKDFRLNYLLIETNNDYEPSLSKEGVYEPVVDFDVFISENQKHFKIPLIYKIKAKQNKKQCKLKKLEIRIEGIFSFPDDSHEEFIHRLVPYNCLSILHGLARGIVADSTGSISGGKFLLPVADLSVLIKKKIEQYSREDNKEV